MREMVEESSPFVPGPRHYQKRGNESGKKWRKNGSMSICDHSAASRREVKNRWESTVGGWLVRLSLIHHSREMLIRHPLQFRWTLRYLKADRHKEWEDCLKCVSLFATVVDSYALYNVIPMGLTWVASFPPISSCSMKEGFIRSTFFYCQAEDCQ
ncbi:hypothetical protein PRIPAC_76330, partial [Pristionchus pacificus]|uniref:Uncharacterized protein n=1 Tax=Pristionchus pacificus TaxID=54126 RepID=A0A2A6CA80_PRIPA